MEQHLILQVLLLVLLGLFTWKLQVNLAKGTSSEYLSTFVETKVKFVFPEI